MLYDTVGLMIQELYISIPFVLLFLAVQLYLCFEMNRIKIKLIPIYIILFVLLFAGNVAVFSSGFTAYVIPSLLTACVALPGLIGLIAAWLVYGIHKKRDRKK